jgi:hypothetical protein
LGWNKKALLSFFSFFGSAEKRMDETINLAVHNQQPVTAFHRLRHNDATLFKWRHDRVLRHSPTTDIDSVTMMQFY